jgi:O-antigen/teichoic acid export membrane protein
MDPVAGDLADSKFLGLFGRTAATQGLATDRESALRKLIPWATKGGFAILDQGLFAGTNFLVNILLARLLTPAEYGAFALAYSIFLLFSTFHTAIFTEPMTIFGSGKYAKELKKYLGILVRLHLAVTLPSGLILLGAAFVVGRIYSPLVERALLGIGLAAPFILLLWLARRAFYIRVQPEWSAVGGALYLLLVLGLINVMRGGHRLSAVTAFLGMGAGAIVVSVFLLLRLGLSWKVPHGNPTVAMVTADHWRYGRWSLATAGVTWFPSNVYYALLPVWIGLEGSGALRAFANLTLPLMHTIGALSVLLLPLLVRVRQGAGTRAMTRTLKSYLALFFSGSAVYLALLWIFRAEAFHLIYAGKYQEYGPWPLILVGILPFSASLTMVLACALRALEHPDWIFWSYVGSSVVALAAGVPLAAVYGVCGALGGLLLSSLTTGMLMFLFYRRASRRQVTG